MLSHTSATARTVRSGQVLAARNPASAQLNVLHAGQGSSSSSHTSRPRLHAGYGRRIFHTPTAASSNGQQVKTQSGLRMRTAEQVLSFPSSFSFSSLRASLRDHFCLHGWVLGLTLRPPSMYFPSERHAVHPEKRRDGDDESTR